LHGDEVKVFMLIVKGGEMPGIAPQIEVGVVPMREILRIGAIAGRVFSVW
jgi:hypothetical protein